MPLYEYQCNACQTKFEELMGAGQNTAPACPTCKSTKTRRLMSATANCQPVAGFGGVSPSGPMGGSSCGSGGFS